MYAKRVNDDFIIAQLTFYFPSPPLRNFKNIHIFWVKDVYGMCLSEFV